MSATDEKRADGNHVEDLSGDALDTENLQNLRGTDALMVAARIEPVEKLSKAMIHLYAICGLMFLGASMGGYDASLMGNLLDMPHFQLRFGASILGVKAGLISSMFSIGSVCSLPFVGPCADTWGRRVGVGLGCAIIIMGTIVQGTAHHLPQYLGKTFSRTKFLCNFFLLLFCMGAKSLRAISATHTTPLFIQRLLESQTLRSFRLFSYLQC
jgi:MFS family permease